MSQIVEKKFFTMWKNPSKKLLDRDTDNLQNVISFSCPQMHLWWNFREDLLAVLRKVADRQTNAGHYIYSLAEVKITNIKL